MNGGNADCPITRWMTDSPDQVRHHAETLMRRRDWVQAAAAFDTLPPESRDFASGLKHNLSRNLASLQIHRRDVYEVLVRLPAQQQFVIGATPSSRPTVHCRRVDGSVVSLAGSPDPLAGPLAAVPKLYEQTPGGEAIAVCGVGDGYLTQLLAQRPPTLFMDKEQPVFLTEPEPQILLQCLMIHDFTGATGAIAHPRFHWFVGSDWHVAMERELYDDPFLPSASVTVGQGMETKSIQTAVGAILQRLLNRDATLTESVHRHYSQVAPADLARLFRLEAQRPPRVLLLTTRLSTVLQFSTRDTAAAFERMGWEARVVIEP